MVRHKVDRRPQARALYAEGVGLAEIADSLDVATRTLKRWKAADKAAGADWDTLREDYSLHDPRAVLAILDRATAAVAERIEKRLNAGGEIGSLADSLQKIDNVRQRFADRFGNLPTVLGVLGELAEWAGENASDDHLTALRCVVADYLTDLKLAHA